MVGFIQVDFSLVFRSRDFTEGSKRNSPYENLSAAEFCFLHNGSKSAVRKTEKNFPLFEI